MATGVNNKKTKRRKAIALRILTAFVLVGIIVGLFFGVRAAYRAIRDWVDSVMNDPMLETTVSDPSVTEGAESESHESQEATEAPGSYAAVLSQAEQLAASYDYDAAIELIRSQPEYARSEVLQDAVQEYLRIKTTLVKVDITQVYHVFFHSLIVDPELAWRSQECDGYNQVMTTVDEFNAMMQQMYERGYVLVKIHDLAYEDADGNFVQGTIMLPEGKKAFVLSVDDVSYYEYMTGDGFADKIVLDEENNPVCEYVNRDGSVSYGNYDVVPLLESFLAQHPDFSYKGARGCIALTGYEGILGYRTAPLYEDPTDPDYKEAYASINVEKEREEAARVCARMKELGWEFASHSWGHINMTNVDIGWFTEDTRKWTEQVAPLVGGTDILIFAFGADLGTWRNYTTENEKYALMKSLGFKYFCPVDSYNIPWVQFNASEGYLRQGRVNLDGYEMYYRADKISIFFDVDSVFDRSRPLPVPAY